MWSKAFNLSTPQKPSQQSNLPPLPASAPPKSRVSSYPLDDENSEVASRVSSSSIKSSNCQPTGAGPSSSTSVNNLRKSGQILKKLWCTPKSAIQKTFGSTTSSEDLGADSPDSNSQASSSLYGVVISAPSSGTAETFEFTSSRTTDPPNSLLIHKTTLDESRAPSLRDLDEDHDRFFATDQSECRMGHSTESTENEVTMMMMTPTQSNRKKDIDNDLEATTSSPENQNDIFLPQGSSSSDEDGLAGATSTATATINALSTPKRLTSSHPMKTPGMGIPTPSTENVDGSRDVTTGSSSLHLPFPHRLDSVLESPLAMAVEENNESTRNQSINTPVTKKGNIDDNDDDAFLPDDFGESEDAFLPDDFKPSKQETYTWDDVQKLVTAAEQKVQEKLAQQHQKQMQEFQEEAERLLFDHGATWRQEAEAEYAVFRQQLKEEKNKTAEKIRELEEREQTLQDLQLKLKTSQETKDNLEIRVRELEESKDTHVLSLTSSNESLEERIAEMEKEMEQLMTSKVAATKEKEELAKLVSEKTLVEQHLADLTKELNAKVDDNQEVSNMLQKAQEEIESLKQKSEEKLLAAAQASMDELAAANAQIDSLRALLAKEEQQRTAMESKLKHTSEAYIFDVTPRKSPADSVPPSPLSPSSGGDQEDIIVKMERQLEGMGRVLKRYKTERDDLREELQQTEKKHVHAIEIAVKQATLEMAGQVQLLHEEIERIRNESTKKTADEINQLTKELEFLKSQHEQELSSLRESSSVELEKDRAEKFSELKNMQMQFEQKENELRNAHKQAIDDLNNQLEELKAKHSQELNQLQIEHEKTSSDRDESASTRQQELEQQIAVMLKMHQEEVEIVRAESGQEIEQFKQKIQKLESDLKLKNEVYENFDGLEQKLDNILSERDELLKTISRLEIQLKELHEQNSVNLREVRAEHGKEIDDLLAQLDMVEAEQNEKAKKLQELVKEKELCLSALSSNLSEAESKLASARNHSERLGGDVEQLRRELEHTKSELISCKLEHERAMEEQIVLREQACEEVQRKIIEKVEKQFDERNAMYKELKRTFEESNSKVSILERDLRFAKKESDELKKRFEAREADLKDELAQAKAAVAKSDANLAHAENNHRSEIERLRDSEEKLRIKLLDAESTSRTVQRTLASIVTEKDKLQLENKELNAICEELMAELEGAKVQK